MLDKNKTKIADQFAAFDRTFLDSAEDFSVIGSGELGGKAHGLALAKQIISERFPAEQFPGIKVGIPTMTVITTEFFDLFMEKNDLYELAYSDAPDDQIAHVFQRAELPTRLVGDLWALIDRVHSPLAVRSSSLLEDAKHEPFAGIYETKMIPNNQLDTKTRFQKLIEAIKFVWASTFFKAAKDYMNSTSSSIEEEKMAVIIQEVIGLRHGDRFYPNLSGVGRSYNFYAFGKSQPEDGVVNLALGLGKAIVDGGSSWTYTPRFPKANPPYNSISQLLQESQRNFWAVNMGKPPAWNPITETEYLLNPELVLAEEDETLDFVASTYDSSSDSLRMGTSVSGPRLVNFAPILKGGDLPVNKLVQTLMKICEEATGSEIEIEFAMTWTNIFSAPVRLGFLQVRPMVVSHEKIDINPDEFSSDNVLLHSDAVLGNGIVEGIRHAVYVKPETFDPAKSMRIAMEIDKINRRMMDEGKPYLLIGFGRWGSADHWLGIPVSWGQIAGAKVMVEAMLKDMKIDLSQGSHFFHNISSFQVSYFSVAKPEENIDWNWLDARDTVEETEFVRCVELPAGLQVKVDGRNGQGVILR